MTIQEMVWQDYRSWNGGAYHTVTGELLILPDFHSPQLNNQRHLQVWLPPSYHHSRQHYPVLYMHDGQNLFDRAVGFGGQEWEVDETMQKLASEGLEAIIVGLPNTERRVQEYNPFPHVWGGDGDRYLTFLVDTVKARIDRDFRTLKQQEHTGIMGSSMGGLISLYGFFQRADVFGFAGVMSPSLWIGGGAIYNFIREHRFVPGKIYLDNGTREQSARKMKALLLEKGYRPEVDLRYVAEVDGEHTESAWARRLPDALRFLLG